MELKYIEPTVKDKEYLFAGIPIGATRGFAFAMEEAGIPLIEVVTEAIKKIVEYNGMLADYLQVFELNGKTGTIKFWAVSNYNAHMTDDECNESGEVYNVLCFLKNIKKRTL